MSLPPLPTGLKSAVGSIVARADELIKAEPIISYYCKLQAVQKILALNLHQTNNEIALYTSQLLDNIESLKVSDPVLTSSQGQSIVTDDQIAGAYVENFALKVFVKADNEVYEHRTTKATASTFMAATVFLDLLRMFQDPLDKDVLGKIKYAKYQATRIIGDYKNDKDPNDYMPPEKNDEDEELEEELEVLGREEQPQEISAAAPPQPAPVAQASARPNALFEAHFEAPSAPAPAPTLSPVSVSEPSVPRAAVGPALTKKDIDQIMTQSDAISGAQKHARYAISALNYEDISTAVVEINKALELLGPHDV